MTRAEPPVLAAAPPDPTRDLAGALHEVSNALTVVIGWIERARGAPPEEVRRALDIAGDRAMQARAIVRRAIGADLPATVSAAVEPRPPLSVAAIVADTVTGLEPELRRAHVEAVVQVSAEVEGRTLDHDATVIQILTNLLLNAVAMSPAGGRVRIEASPGTAHTLPPGEGVTFAVVDQGPGVPAERRATLFQASVSTRAGGAGIGLRHSAALAQSLGGRLALGEGEEGARFELTWPFATGAPIHDGGSPPMPPAAGAPRSRPTPLPPESGARAPSDHDRPRSRGMPLSGTRILLVEDDDAVVDLLDTALTARGADVVSVRHRRELPEALSTGRFDAALFDISPIQEDVRGAVAMARGGPHAGLRVVLISGSAAQMPEMPDEWVAAWVRKPFEIGEILDAIAPVKMGGGPPYPPPQAPKMG